MAARCLGQGDRMRAVTCHGKRDVRVDSVDDPTIQEPTDAIVRVTSSGICGSDLHLTQVRERRKGAALFGYTALYGGVPGAQAELPRTSPEALIDLLGGMHHRGTAGTPATAGHGASRI